MRYIQVMIPVAIDTDGNWNAVGCNARGDQDAVKLLDDMCELAREGVSDGEQLHYVRAQIPVPEPETIRGIVS